MNWAGNGLPMPWASAKPSKSGNRLYSLKANTAGTIPLAQFWSHNGQKAGDLIPANLVASCGARVPNQLFMLLLPWAR